MKRSTLIVTGIALGFALCVANSRAQDNPPTPAQQPVAPITPGQSPPTQPGPGQQPPFQRPMPPRVRQPRMFVQRTLADLRMLKMELQRSQDDFSGHKDSAIEACDKATQELDALMKAMPLPTPQQGGLPPGNRSFQSNLTPIAPGAGAPPGQNAPVPPPAPASPPSQPPPQP